MQINRGLAVIVAVLLLVVSGVAGIYLAPMIHSGAGVESIDIGERYQGELTTKAPLNIKDGSRYRKLSVSLSADEIAVFTLESSFPGALTLYDENMQRVATAESDRWSANQDERQSTELSYRADEDGQFFLVASGAEENSYGPFRVTSEAINIDSETPLSGTGEVGGWLQGENQTRTLEIEESGLYIINLTSNAFDTTLELSGNGVSQEDDDSGEGMNSRIQAMLDPGTYELAVGSYGSSNASGLYTLSVDSQELPSDGSLRNGGPLELGETISGLLQNDPATFSFTVEETGLFAFDLSSDHFDTRIFVEGNGINVEDDDGGDGMNSLLETPLEPGEYTIRVEAYGSGSGLFTLSTSSTPLPEDGSLRTGGPLEIGETISGLLQSDQATFNVTVEEAGLFTFDLSSDHFDTKIFVEGNGIDVEDDDGGDGMNSLLETPLEPGEYTIRVEAYGNGSGLFTLSTSRSAIPEGAEMQNNGDIAPGASIRGMLSRESNNSYHLVIDQAGQYTINARSSSFDTYLELSGNGISETDDDGGSGVNSQLQVTLQPGEYQLIVRDVFDRGSGMYQLEVQ